ncbi:MAG TPA: TetR/AcrR family transcriptional regulator [Actinomycetota bacterium]|nr:TetR/AcrR family transcriptional regulator [Actinomycetota bacterium]
MGSTTGIKHSPPQAGRATHTGTQGTDRAAETRRRILDTAAAVFADHGYLGTSLNQLIAATGLAKGGFYFHFPSKQALALACLQDKQEQWIGKVMSAALRHDRAIDQLVSIPHTLCDVYEQDPSYACVGKLSLELMEREPQLVPQVRPALLAWVRLTSELVRRGQQEGDVRAELDPDAVAEVAVASVIGIEKMAACLSGGADFRRRVEAFVPLFRDSIAIRKGGGDGTSDT